MNALTTSWNERVHDTREELNTTKASLLEAERKMTAMKETLEETVDRKNLLEKTTAEMKKQVGGIKQGEWETLGLFALLWCVYLTASVLFLIYLVLSLVVSAWDFVLLCCVL